MIRIELDKKFKKRLYDINQELKTVFSRYNIYPDNIIIANNTNENVQQCAYLDNRDGFPIELDTYIISLDSTMVYKVYSDDKKNLEYLYMDKNKLIIGNNEFKYEIGSYYESQSISAIKYDKIKDVSTEIINAFSPEITLDKELVESMSKGNLVIVGGDHPKYKTRITRTLIPGLKKSSKVDIYFDDMDSSDVLYRMIIRNKRNSGIYTYHKRTCIAIRAKD